MKFQKASLYLLPHDAWVAYLPNFVDHYMEVRHWDLLRVLRATLPLQQETIRVFGRWCTTPRLVSWHGDTHCVYRYSQREFQPSAWTEELHRVRVVLREVVGADFNSVLVNHYRDGRDSMGAHSDDEPELGPSAPTNVLIASVSLGGTRRFLLQSKRSKQNRVEFSLYGGSLLLMGGTTQQHFTHYVPQQRRVPQPRMNLTFRIVRRALEEKPL